MGDNRQSHRDLDRLEEALAQALALVRSTPRDDLTATTWLETAAKVGGHLSEARDASSDVRQSLLGGARTSLLFYLRGHVGQTVPPHALEGVAGIRAWARRIRELRAVGWDIRTLGAGPTAAYKLEADHLDEAVALSDQVIDSISGTEPKERLLEYLLHICPWAAGPDQLSRVAGPTWRQEIKELVEDGWLIRSHEDESDLAPGFYRLARLED